VSSAGVPEDSSRQSVQQLEDSVGRAQVVGSPCSMKRVFMKHLVIISFSLFDCICLYSSHCVLCGCLVLCYLVL